MNNTMPQQTDPALLCADTLVNLNDDIRQKVGSLTSRQVQIEKMWQEAVP